MISDLQIAMNFHLWDMHQKDFWRAYDGQWYRYLSESPDDDTKEPTTENEVWRAYLKSRKIPS